MSSTTDRLHVAMMARGNRTWRGVLQVAAFERLGGVLANAAGRVDVALDFAAGDDGRPHVTGRCELSAEVCCTGCLRVAPVAVRSDIDFSVVATEAEARSAMPAVDAVVCAEPTVPVTWLIEDDLLLSVPESACADRRVCPHAEALRAESTSGEAEIGAASPFAALRELAWQHGGSNRQ